ncbi:MAG: addiction module protein [Smithellaceae bacterium]
MSIDEIATQAMALPGEARALLAEKIVESLHQESIQEIWLTEAKKRREEVRSGRAKSIPGDEAMQSVRDVFNCK